MGEPDIGISVASIEAKAIALFLFAEWGNQKDYVAVDQLRC
jgi:hypothetical protein